MENQEPDMRFGSPEMAELWTEHQSGSSWHWISSPTTIGQSSYHEHSKSPDTEAVEHTNQYQPQAVVVLHTRSSTATTHRKTTRGFLYPYDLGGMREKSVTEVDMGRGLRSIRLLSVINPTRQYDSSITSSSPTTAFDPFCAVLSDNASIEASSPFEEVV
ncbi:hypothetical protein BDQ17DRAFT_1335239 [Cyathus striatus]|nr:hypothetical protein BDQ17DRAFT_1335239 [Cyathus striatus]